MTCKYITIFLLGLVCSVISEINEDDIKKWFDDTIEEFGDACKRKISEESMQELKDDYQADNEEIRNFRFCLAVKRKYIVKSEIDTKIIMAELEKYAERMNFEERELAQKMLANCKAEGEGETGKKNIFGKFTACVIDRCKSGL